MYSKVKSLCKERKIQLSEVAKKMGITVQALSQSLSGNPHLDRIKEVADIIGVSVADMLPDDYKEAKHTNEMCCPHCGKPIVFYRK